MSGLHQDGVKSVGRAAALLKLLAGGRATTLGKAARSLGLPVSTAHRIAGELARHGLIIRVGRGRYAAGFGLIALGRATAPNAVLVEAARPILRRLAASTGRTAHMAQFDQDMVTYLIREAPPGGRLFTREAMQLEAYCSGIGKMLLAMAPPDQRDAYLAGGMFVPLTSRTMTDPEALRAHLDCIAAQGFSIDDEEVEEGLYCLAIPLRAPDGIAPTALSLAGDVADDDRRNMILAALREAREELHQAFGLSGGDGQSSPTLPGDQ